MEKNFIYSDSNKRYHTYNYFLKEKFSCKVAKLSLNAGFSCPNLDGSKGFGGCTYCSDSGSGDFAGNVQQSIFQQIQEQKIIMQKKWKNCKFIAYFQARTNTYAPLPKLKEIFEPVLEIPDIVGISIATRADCLDAEKADYLAELSKKTFLEVELGLQSVFDSTGERINRCHSYAEFLQGYNLLKERNIPVCIHIINGLPGENYEMMMETVRQVALLKPNSVKIHLLHIIKNTVLAKQWENFEFKAMDFDEYISLLCDQLEILPAEIVIQRVTGDGDRKTLLAPLWSMDKKKVMNSIDLEMVRRNSYQGIKAQNLK